MINSDNFGKFISAKRKEMKISQVDLAKKLNVDPKTLSKWENGGCYPDLESACAIAEIFNISLNDILDEKFDTKLIEDKKILTFNTIFFSATILLSILFIILKHSSVFHIIIEAPILLSSIFLLNVLSIVVLIVNKNTNNGKMLSIFAKILYFLTTSFLFFF